MMALDSGRCHVRLVADGLMVAGDAALK